MAYVNGKERKREVQYCVISKESPYKGIKQCIWASEKEIQAVFKTCNFNEGNYGTKHIIDMKHIVFTGKPEDIKKSKKLAKAHFIEGMLGSLEFHVDTEEDAIKCLKYFNLR